MKQLLLVFGAILTLASCSKTGFNPTDALYINTFESESELDQIQGMRELSDDTPSDGDNQSLSVAGGCVVPHSYINVGPFDQDFNVYLEVSGKILISDGYVSFSVIGDSEQSVGVSLDQEDWKQYKTEAIFCQAGEIIQIHFISGGLAQGHSLFDNLAIYPIAD